MKKVIENLELLKKLQPYIEEKEPHPKYGFYSYCDDLGKIDPVYKKVNPEFGKYRVPRLFTLTLEEAMDLLPIYTHIRQIRGGEWLTDNKAIGIKDKNIWGKTKLQAIEKMLEYLVDNNLLEND